MDIPRGKAYARKKRIKQIIYAVLAVGVIFVITLGLSRLKPAAPSVEKATVYMDTVKRGPMVRQVRGLGTLVPVEIRWIPAITNGRVERKLVQPGAVVKADTVLLELSNEELEQTTLNAEWDLKAAEAAYTDLQKRLENQLLNEQSSAARVKADLEQARLRAEANERLATEGLLPAIDLELSKVTAQELANRYRIEEEKLKKSAESVDAQMAVQRARVEQLRAIYGLRKSFLDALKVRAGVSGVLQLLPVEVGQQVTPGTNLARVADPSHLKAELRIAETQAKDIAIGQPVLIDTRNGVVNGKVIRIDPSVQNGTVTVDASLDGDLPKGARPDLSVDGTIELERLPDVLYVGRPVQGQAGQLVGLFKLDPDGKGAERIQVRLGRSSVNTIEILEGLAIGDQVVLSDMSAWDAFDRIRLN